jgi:hypothetical protein
LNLAGEELVVSADTSIQKKFFNRNPGAGSNNKNNNRNKNKFNRGKSGFRRY